jgi:predicted RNA-binding Zn ribbon-like protein
MVFTYDTKWALEAAVDLVNTLPDTSSEDVDSLTDLEQYEQFLGRYDYTGTIRRDADELRDVRAIRGRLLQLWRTDREGAVPLVNSMLADGEVRPQLVIHDGYDWHIHATSDDAPFATRILVETAMAFVDVIRADGYDRVRTCSADDCASVYVDYSKNSSKRYCDTGNCGNRMNVNAYRRRRAGGTD